MTPFALARSVYESEPCARTFEEDFAAHLENGYVYNSPALFAMFRPVCTHWPDKWIIDPWEELHPAEYGIADCWHVYLAAGAIAELANLIPYPLPWVSFERKNRLRLHSYHEMRVKVSRIRWNLSTDPFSLPILSAPTVG